MKHAHSEEWIHTYTYGPDIRLTCDVTKGNMVQLCLSLNEEFTTEGFTFEPDPIGNGFIKFSNYDNPNPTYSSIGSASHPDLLWRNPQEGEAYKCIRFMSGSFGNQAWVPPDVMTSWKDDNEVIHEAAEDKKKSSGGTLLKAFHGAPAWTRAELDRFLSVFAKYGIQKRGNRMGIPLPPKSRKNSPKSQKN